MDFHIVDSHTSLPLDNLNHSCIVVRLIDVSIQRMDFQVILVSMCTLVDDFSLRNEHLRRMNRYHRLYGIHDSIDRMLHHPNNLRCTDKCHVHMKSMGFLVFQLDKCNWLDDFVPNIQHHDRIEFHRMYMD